MWVGTTRMDISDSVLCTSPAPPSCPHGPVDKAPALHPHDPGSNPGPAIFISSNSSHFYFACLYRGYACSGGFRCACPIGRWVGGSLGGSVVGLGCAWMAYRLWVAGGAALCPGAFRCAYALVVWWVKLVFSCFSGSRCVQLSPTVLGLVVPGNVGRWGALWMDWAARG